MAVAGSRCGWHGMARTLLDAMRCLFRMRDNSTFEQWVMPSPASDTLQMPLNAPSALYEWKRGGSSIVDLEFLAGILTLTKLLAIEYCPTTVSCIPSRQPPPSPPASHIEQ